jgi:tRNA G18 (ribose-2'-O)-methylase SpoU
MQTTHTQNKFKPQKFPIVLVCDKIRSPENIGMILRVAESFGVEKILFDKESPSPRSRSVKRISRDTNKLVSFEIIENSQEELQKLQREKYKVIALEITSDSKPVKDLVIDSGKIALVLGAERNGISKKLLDLCDEECHIEMFGTNSSMNVANALSIALYEITGKMMNV